MRFLSRVVGLLVGFSFGFFDGLKASFELLFFMWIQQSENMDKMLRDNTRSPNNIGQVGMNILLYIAIAAYTGAKVALLTVFLILLCVPRVILYAITGAVHGYLNGLWNVIRNIPAVRYNKFLDIIDINLSIRPRRSHEGANNTEPLMNITVPNTNARSNEVEAEISRAQGKDVASQSIELAVIRPNKTLAELLINSRRALNSPAPDMSSPDNNYTEHDFDDTDDTDDAGVTSKLALGTQFPS